MVTVSACIPNREVRRRYIEDARYAERAVRAELIETRGSSRGNFEMALALGSRILYVDDDKYSRDWVQHSLKNGGVKASVVSAESGRDAFMNLKKQTFDLCVLE